MIISLSQKERMVGREWRIKKCGSADFNVLFQTFKGEVLKKRKNVTNG